MNEATTYQKGFNQGYVLAEHAPALVEALKPDLNANNDYLKAIVQGADQYQKDKTLEKYMAQSKDEQSLKQNKSHDNDKDMIKE